jgi:hypothetical protein
VDELDDIGGLGKLDGEAREPEQGLLVLVVVGISRHLLEDGEARVVEALVVERYRHLVLGDLAVAAVVARLAALHAIEHECRLEPAVSVEGSLGERRLLGHLTWRWRQLIVCGGEVAALVIFEIDDVLTQGVRARGERGRKRSAASQGSQNARQRPTRHEPLQRR